MFDHVYFKILSSQSDTSTAPTNNIANTMHKHSSRNWCVNMSDTERHETHLHDHVHSCVSIVMTVGLLTGQVASSHVNKYSVETLGYPNKNLEFRHGFIEDIAAAGIEVPAVHQCMLASPSN